MALSARWCGILGRQILLWCSAPSVPLHFAPGGFSGSTPWDGHHKEQSAWKSTSLLLFGYWWWWGNWVSTSAEHWSVIALISAVALWVQWWVHQGADVILGPPTSVVRGSTPVCISIRFTHRASLQIQFCNDCSAVEVAVPQAFVIFVMLLYHLIWHSNAKGFISCTAFQLRKGPFWQMGFLWYLHQLTH